MFSEYASRFLSQSQSQVGDGADRTRRANHGPSRFAPSRSQVGRAAGNNPYQTSSHLSPFRFSTRASAAQQAPLFRSATDEFREEDDEQEHEREIADFYALQKSRRQFSSGGGGPPAHLKESSEFDDDSKSSETSEGHKDDNFDDEDRGGIRSSWRGGMKSAAARTRASPDAAALSERNESDDDAPSGEGPSKSPSGRSGSPGKGKMVDVRLEDTLRSTAADDYDDEPPDFGKERPPPPRVRRFQEQSPDAEGRNYDDDGDEFRGSSRFLAGETDRQALLDRPQGPPSPSAAAVPPTVSHSDVEPPQHDAFWGHLFLLSMAGLLASAFVVYLQTSVPDGKPGRLGDTIYSTIHRSFSLLGVYTVVSVFVSLLWLALLRSYVRPLVYGILIAVPVILYSFSLYPFISSFKGTWHGSSVQDKVMRWGSLVPAIIASVWVYCIVKGRHSIGKATSILDFSCRILGANPALLAVGFAALVVIASWTWLWILMFTRVFLGGHYSGSKGMFIIDLGSWWLGVYFILVYLWSLGVIAGIQRTTTAATVSQWYFHRLTVPAPSSIDIIRAALMHSCTTLFGTVCLSTLLALLIRLPLIVLPSRLSGFISLAAYSVIPTPIVALTNPLALTYAAIHSQPLTASARSLSYMTHIAPPTSAMTFHPRSFSDAHQNDASSLMPYRLAKLLLHATRFIMSLALGFGGWVSTARKLQVATEGGTSSASGGLYAYVVGLISGAIGWGVLGAMEGVLASVVDAAIVCWASETGGTRKEARYCREAGVLFGEGGGGGSGAAYRVATDGGWNV